MKNKKGFTIIELVVVILILGMLSTIALVSISRIRNSANDKEISTIRTSIISAFDNYRIDNGISKNTSIKISNLKFDKNLSYNNSACSLKESDTIKYIVKGDYYNKFITEEDRLKYGVCMTETIINENKTETKCTSTPSKAEEYCIKLECNGKVIIDDYNDDSSLCSK